MSGITQLSEKMKKKLSFGDYNLSTEATLPQKETAKTTVRKIYSLPKEESRMLREIHARRLEGSQQISIAQVMAEAIKLLYTREIALYPDNKFNAESA